MMVKKYSGKTTREALRKMREDLGSDAMILSSRQTPQGIEMVAMAQAEVNELVDAGGGFESIRPESMPRQRVQAPTASVSASSLMSQRVEQSAGSLNEPGHSVPAKNAAPSTRPKTLRDLAEEVSEESVHVVRGVTPPAPAVWRNARSVPAPTSPPDPMMDVARAMQQAAAQQALQAQQETVRLLQTMPGMAQTGIAAQAAAQMGAVGMTDPALLQELKNMRAMLESQMSGLAWRESLQRNPQRAQCWRELHEAGFSPAFARVVAENLPDDCSLEQARQWVQAVLLRNLPQVPAGQDLVEQGGVWALVGPTGVGKTTTTAKLAARCVVKYGVQSLGLITTDTYRVGAHDQLKIYAKILGVQVYSAHALNDLQSMLTFLSSKRLVLIDTVGMGQRDNRVAEQIAMLTEARVGRVLLLNAAAQSETLEDVVQVYRGPSVGEGLTGAIITKLDEAVKSGAVLDTLMRHKLPLHFMTNGQRVPEDLHGVNAPMLIHRALKPAVVAPAFALSESEFDQTLSVAATASVAGVTRAPMQTFAGSMGQHHEVHHATARV